MPGRSGSSVPTAIAGRALIPDRNDVPGGVQHRVNPVAHDLVVAHQHEEEADPPRPRLPRSDPDVTARASEDP
jgi:hypothetical protein